MAAVRMSAREMIERLISFDTTSRESNLELIHFVADYLDGHGVASTLIHDESGTKANLYATIGPEIDGGVVLSGHTDVVPVDGQDWSSDPFQVVERDGMLVGRGTADMKSFIAIALALTPDFAAAKLRVPVHFAFSYDEEVGCLGVHGIVSHIEGMTTKPMAVIVGEPTDMTVVNAHKDCCSMITVVTGLEGHSSATQLGVNSIMHGAELVSFLAGLADEFMTRELDERFTPPYTTVEVGVIQGGTAANIIPRQTKITWGCRALDRAHVDEIRSRFEAFATDEVLPRMRERHADCAIETHQRSRIPALMPENGSPAETLALMLAGSNRTYAVSYGTEGGIFQEAGIPTVVCGPGNIAQAHKPDEFVTLSQIAECETFMRRLIKELRVG